MKMSFNKNDQTSETRRRPIMILLDALSRRWALRILWELRDGRLTFRTLQERCDDVSPTTLNRRLKELRALQLLDHTSQGFGYTQRGLELSEHLMSLNTWAQSWEKGL